MEHADSRKEQFCINTALEINLKNFRTAQERGSTTSTELRNPHRDFEISFFASVSPVRKYKTGKDWLVVSARERVQESFVIPNKSVLTWIVSIIDVKGNSKCPRSFQKYYRDQRYVERSFILNNEDEFLSNGVLTLRFDVYFAWSGLLISFDRLFINLPMQRGNSYVSQLDNFYRSIPQAVCFKNDCPSSPYTVFDFTFQILSLPQFHEKRKSFGVYGIPPCNNRLWLSGNNKDSFEHIWIFDTYPDKFILSLDERQESVGALLLKTSPFIRRCVDVPMKEQRERRIDFSNVESQTFKILLFFLETGTLPRSRTPEVAKLYNFSHLYQLEILQQNSADHMVRNSKLQQVFELQKMANFYSDEYFLTELFSKLYDCQIENSILKGFGMDDKPDSDCYI